MNIFHLIQPFLFYMKMHERVIQLQHGLVHSKENGKK